jgi:hypothetical protein
MPKTPKTYSFPASWEELQTWAGTATTTGTYTAGTTVGTQTVSPNTTLSNATTIPDPNFYHVPIGPAPWLLLNHNGDIYPDIQPWYPQYPIGTLPPMEWYHYIDPQDGTVKVKKLETDPILELLIKNGFESVVKLEQQSGEYGLYSATRDKETCLIRVKLDQKTQLPVFELEKIRTKDSPKNRYEIINDDEEI